jgi:ribosome-associated protein
MAEELRINERLSLPPGEVELRTSRSSGPGGQHANVTASRVEAVFDVERSRALSEEQRTRLLERLGPVVTAVAQEARGQARNRELALRRLAQKIAAGRRRLTNKAGRERIEACSATTRQPVGSRSTT